MLPDTAVSPTGPLTFTPEQLFNVVDYGAKCDGSTDDTAAVNATIAAAASSAAYTSNNSVRIVGPLDGTHKGCNVTQINATLFTSWGTGKQVLIEDLSLNCSGSGNICFDTTGALNLNTSNLTLVGSSLSPPAIGLQEANKAPATIGCCIHKHWNPQVVGTWTFTALYNAGSESTSYFAPIFRNDGASVGPIRAPLGAITAGAAYTDGTYTAVALTGGTGTGALATIIVAGGVVITVTVTYQGKGYTAGDTLSASAADIGGTGSGFSVPVSSIGGYAVVMDGQNYWRVSSPWQAITWPTDRYFTFTQNNFFAGSIRYFGASTSGAPLWLGSGIGHKFDRTYIATTTATECVQLFDNSATNDPGNAFLDLNIACETPSVTSTFFLYGARNSPILQSFRFRSDTNEASTSIFSTDTNLTTVTAANININQLSQGATPVLFSAPKIWAVSGNVYVSAAAVWNQPASFSGTLCLLTSCSLPNLGPLDIVAPASGAAYSCSRLLRHTYTGALCKVERASDSATVDLYPDATGNMSLSNLNIFCLSTTCSVTTLYDQSGNNNNATQATLANQPGLATDAILGGRLAMSFGDAGAVCLSVAASATIDSLWAAGGYASLVTHPNVNTTQADRTLYKQNWELRYNAGGSSVIGLFEAAATSNGSWTTPASGTGGRVVDIKYSSASVANVPAIGINSTTQTLTSTQPVGAITSDAGIAMLIGNNDCATGTRGYPGNIAEIVLWKATPTTTQLTAIRRNQAAYYGLSATN